MTRHGRRDKRVALYLRVSTDEQTTRNQRRELQAAAERHGWTVTATFEDAGISGRRAARTDQAGRHAQGRNEARG